MNLGKYLGMPVLHKRVNKETFSDILERVSSKLAGWKSRSLSFAGRLTLTKAVLTSIPIHTMNVISMPQATLEALEKLSRSFVWGSTIEKRKQHLLAWKKVCKPKREGGVGIRNAKEMNKALLAKMGWRLMQNRTSLWACVFRSKYKVGDIRDMAWVIPKGTWSATWRSVCTGLREVAFNGQSWVVGNGREVRFWKDKWLLNTPLLESMTNIVPVERLEDKVSDMWREGTGWLWGRARPYVSDQICLRLGALVIDNVTGARDRLSWGENDDGVFTVTSAYQMLTRETAPSPNMEKFWQRIWTVGVPERIRTFLWLVGHQVIMSNSERHRRHLSDTSICSVCKGGEETTLHILRDCPAIAGLWRRVVPTSRLHDFFMKSILEWLYENLGRDNNNWSTLFGVTVWWAWKWRCGNVFGTNGQCRDRVKFVKDLAKEVAEANAKVKGSHAVRERVDRMISWKPPKHGWIKVNTDGASRGNPGVATAGGVLRDERGRWQGGFSLHIGICSAPLAELWGVYYGLYMAWGLCVARVELEVDSETVAGFLKNGVNDSHPLSFLVRLCHGFISRDWNVRITHVYREANRLADGLANYAFSLALGFHSFDVAPSDVFSILEDDGRGTSFPRRVCV